MADATPASDFVRLLARAILRDGDPAALAAEAAETLASVFATRKSLVLEVQFTGFSQKGQLVGGVDPTVLRAAGHLITLRVNRVGFTPEATADDLAAFFAAASRPAAELAGEGVVAAVARAQPRGLYLSTSTGDVYRPPAAAPAESSPTEEAASAETASSDAASSPETAPPASATAPPAPAVPKPAGGFDFGLEEGDGADLSDFELIDDVPDLGAPAAPMAAPASSSPSGVPAAGGGGGPAGDDMFHFFRAVKGDRADEEAEQLPALLHAADNVPRFDELAQAAARAAGRLVRSDQYAQAVGLLDALVREAERPDRTRLFRDAAVQSLRRVGTGETLHHLADLLPHGGAERERILRFFVFLGGDAVTLMETILFRTGDADLRRDLFLHLVRMEGMSQRIAARAMADASPARTRSLLELAVLPEVDAEVSQKWIAEAAAHADPSVRADAARHAAALGGRGGLRLMVDLLNDRDLSVARAAIQGMGSLGDPAAVPFLTRLLNDADEELQVAAIASLGRLGAPDALPALLGVVNRRALFGGKKMARVKTAAVSAIGKIPTPAAREVLASIAAGKDAELASEAGRILATAD